MCAISGILNFDPDEPVDGAVIRKMAAAMAHRGPDDDGFLVEGPVGLGFRRLSIIDLQGGHQPILNEDGSIAIIFNGEIYNYRDLAPALAEAGHVFKTRSDTETILHAYEQYGDACVDHLRGMFAFAIWDRNRRRLLLARDRLGVKPLYYYVGGRFLAFASEIKALLEIPAVAAEVDPEALDQYLALRFVPGPATMFRNIFRLQPGHLLIAGQSGIQHQQYWDVRYPEQPDVSAEDMVEDFRDLLEESVRLRLVSEVPLGVFLSGGLDSSAILAAMSKMAGGRVKTFSVGYEAPAAGEADISEFEYARMAANAFGADHYEYRLTAREFQDFVPTLVWHLDEPLADSTCIPLHFISRLAKEHITVVLSGEGADEILAGYSLYAKAMSLQRFTHAIPGASLLAQGISHLLPSEKLRQYARLGASPDSGYRGVCRGFHAETRRSLIGDVRWRQSERLLARQFAARCQSARNASPLNRMLYVDTKIWLPDDLLVKADKMTMANGLELRVPFLDHRLVEFAARLPEHAKLHGGRGKMILRDAMRGVLPDTIIDRPKKGFPVPLAAWLRGPVRDFTRDHLLSPRSACGAYLDRATMRRIVEQHERGADRSEELWTLLVFELWHRQFIERGSHGREAAA